MFAEKSDGKCLFQGLEPEKTYSSHHSAPRILKLSDCGKPTKKKAKNTERQDLEFNFLILLSISSTNKQILPTETPKKEKKKKKKKKEEFTLTIADDSRLLGGG